MNKSCVKKYFELKVNQQVQNKRKLTAVSNVTTRRLEKQIIFQTNRKKKRCRVLCHIQIEEKTVLLRGHTGGLVQLLPTFMILLMV